MDAEIVSFLHEDTGTFTYLVWDPATSKAAVIDPVLDYDAAAGRTGTTSADQVVAAVREKALDVEWILETHAHADHLSAGKYLRDELGASLAIGGGIRKVQDVFKGVFNLDEDFATDGSQFDHLFSDGETFHIGDIEARVLHTPGHTNDSLTYVIGDAAFVGDTLFMPDSGTARCDFPGGSAGLLFDSIQKIFALGDETRLFMCHDYGAGGEREHRCETTVGEERETNIHVGDGRERAEYVALRQERDAVLDMPRLIFPSVQFNIRAGEKPPAEPNGTSYFKIPLDRF